jgi:hypothetical protein
MQNHPFRARIGIAGVMLLAGSCGSTHELRLVQDLSVPQLEAASTPQTLLFVTTSSTDTPHRPVLTLDFAVIAREKGHDVAVFLAGDATMLLKPNVRSAIHAPGQPSATELMAKARDLGVRVLV